MEFFRKKYTIRENADTEEYHRSRRMFYVYKNKLSVAEPKVLYSHAVWFYKLGLISKDNDQLMNKIVRGIVDCKGNVYFYIGYDFQINNKVEEIFFLFLPELVKKLKLKSEAEVFGGVKNKLGQKKVPRKEYGKIKNLFFEELGQLTKIT